MKNKQNEYKNRITDTNHITMTPFLSQNGKIGVCCHSGLAERNAEYHVNSIFYRD